jgi:hypothetical protein
MSAGCLRCCKYGSEEQRHAQAKRLAAAPLPGLTVDEIRRRLAVYADSLSAGMQDLLTECAWDELARPAGSPGAPAPSAPKT